MLIANFGHSAAPMLRGLGGTAEITKMQQALVNLAVSTNRPQFNPGRVDGVLDDATMIAVAAAFSVAAGELPSSLSSITQLALIGGATTSTAKSYVGQYASQLAIAFNAAAVKYKSTPTVPVGPTLPIPVAGAWYTTWWGIGGIIVGGAVILKFLLGGSQKAA